jgi:DSF synthase
MDLSLAHDTDLVREVFQELETRYDPDQRALWCYLSPSPSSRPCCSLDLLSEYRRLLHAIEQRVKRDSETANPRRLSYLVIASRTPGVFNLGGDLVLFLDLIRAGDRDGLFNYAKTCVDLLHASLSLPITTISLVQGDALGGAFEGALGCRVLIAEKRAHLGFPEILFNMFPGMGAYSLLSRKIGAARAERLILSGRLYKAEEMHDMGVVDVVAEDGTGEEAVRSYIRKQNRAANGYEAIRRIRQRYEAIPYEELLDVTREWVDSAFRLQERDLRIMERFATSQDKLVPLPTPVRLPRIA